MLEMFGKLLKNLSNVSVNFKQMFGSLRVRAVQARALRQVAPPRKPENVYPWAYLSGRIRGFSVRSFSEKIRKYDVFPLQLEYFLKLGVY